MGTVTLLRINRDRLQQRLDALAAIGQLPAGGVRRTAYSVEDLAARQCATTAPTRYPP